MVVIGILRALLGGALLCAALPARANQWRDLAPAANAGRKDGQLMAYDSRSGMIVLFGDHAVIDTTDEETWAYDVGANSWLRMMPQARPTPHGHGAMVYDAGSDLVVLFGGQSDAGPPLGETWTYDVDADVWTDQAPADPVPAPREWHAMAYDEACDLVVLFGGTGDLGGSAMGDTWVYDVDANLWQERSPPAPTPAGQFWHAMTYDAGLQRVLLAARNGETWAYDCAGDGWQLLAAAGPAFASSDIARMAFDIESGMSFLLNDDGTTWGYDSTANTWTNMLPSGPTPQVHHHDLVYVGAIDSLVLYGERSAFQPTGTWAYSHAGGQPVPDAGPIDRPDAAIDAAAGGADAAPETPGDGGGCDCSTTRRAPDGPIAALILALALAFRWRPGRRRSRRRRGCSSW